MNISGKAFDHFRVFPNINESKGYRLEEALGIVSGKSECGVWKECGLFCHGMTCARDWIMISALDTDFSQ